MFCYQCEQTRAGQGCDQGGVCGKTSQVSDLSDLLTYYLKTLALTATRARAAGYNDRAADRFLVRGLYASLTNVDFDPNSLSELLDRAVHHRERLLKASGIRLGEEYCPSLAESLSEREIQAQAYPLGSLGSEEAYLAKEAISLRETALYGLRGLAAYVWHAQNLGYEDDALYAALEEALAKTLDSSLGVEDLLALALEVGRINLTAMELLDKAHTESFGHPEPTKVELGYHKGPAILISGHDLGDLKDLLNQINGQDIKVYTHGEMLPAHGYPDLKGPDLCGHYGTGWPNQVRELNKFPGPIVFTSNCLTKPDDAYIDRVFLTGPVAYPGVRRLHKDASGKIDFGPVIKSAIKCAGYKYHNQQDKVTVGWGHKAILSQAQAVVNLIKIGKLQKILLVGGCDGGKSSRDYYRQLVAKTKADTLVLTLGCGKFRFFDLNLGDIGGVPRLLDLGQCNDAFTAITVAAALAGALEMSLGDLPLYLILSWFEQKACAILLTLLHLGIKNIRLGPSLPAFVHPNILSVLVDKYNLAPTTTPEGDLAAIGA
ncbi:MAG: hydroxylamine reductase [Deltaproteobacteria bacterium]|jgi:hydroxylamine reductase|nr:hydroxylamine reductase [Deltaproteobacteria bacterium]